MNDHRIPIQRQGRVVIGYSVSAFSYEAIQTEGGHWSTCGRGTQHRHYTAKRTAMAALNKALTSGSCSASMHTIVIPERLWP